jgi:hypothetical protein
MTSSDAASSILIPFITAAAGLLGVIVGSWLTDRREREKQRRDYITRQLSELYGPLLSLRRQVNARYALRERISAAIPESWDDDRVAYLQREGIDAKIIKETIDAELATFFEHDRRSFERVLMPDYQRMVTLLRDNMWLAEKSTRENFDSLIEYVDSLEFLNKGIIKGIVFEKLALESWGEPEFKLRPFYADLEEIHDRLRADLTTNRVFAARVKQLLHRRRSLIASLQNVEKAARDAIAKTTG